MKSICAPVCGDGYRKTPTESCDDGNFAKGDGCSDACLIETGYACSKPLDAQGAPITSMPDICKPICGDGLVKGNEECDDNNSVNNDVCNNTCSLVCGNGT